VARLNRQLRQQADLDLPPTRLAHLATIERRGPLTLGELAAIERVAPATVTKVVDHLERLDLARRQRDPRDRRVTRVEATAAGRARLAETRTRKHAWLAQQVAALDPDAIGRLAASLDVLEGLAQPELHDGAAATSDPC
jgi:DNA-binding MarR family transcriptional regulator